MEQYDNKVSNMTKGMAKDVDLFKHQEDMTYHVTNGIYEEFDGESFTLQNEQGNQVCFDAPGMIIGHVNMGRDEILIVSTEGNMTYIGIVTKCEYRNLVTTSCLNLDKCNPIKGKFRIVGGCDRVVYLYDGKNNDLSLNIDNLSQYTQTFSTGEKTVGSYTVEEANAEDLWDCNEMKLEPDFLLPCICEAKLVEGGNLPLGTYKFSTELMDSSENRIGFGPISDEIRVYPEGAKDSEGNEIIAGGLNTPVHTPDVGGKLPTNRAIELTICNLDDRFPLARLHVIQSITGDGFTEDAYAKGDLINVTGDTATYLFTGVDVDNGDVAGTVAEIVIPEARYTSSGAMELVNDRLVRANLKKEIPNWSAFQRAASQIDVEYAIKETTEVNVDDTSLMGDEIYALGVEYEMKQGYWTRPFNIPGRCRADNQQVQVINPDYVAGVTKLTTYAVVMKGIEDGEYDYEVSINASIGTFGADAGAGNVIKFEGTISGLLGPEQLIYQSVFPLSIISGLPNFITPKDGATGQPYYEVIVTETEIPPIGIPKYITVDQTDAAWQSTNTSFITEEGFGKMGYHECETACYPDVKDCNGESVWGVDSCGNPLANTPVRHHRMPSRCQEPHHRGDTKRLIGLRFSNIVYPHPDVIGHRFVRSIRTDNTKTVRTTGYLAGSCEATDYVGLTRFIEPDSVHNQLLSPDIFVGKKLITGDYVNLIHNVPTELETRLMTEYSEVSKNLGGDDLFIGRRIFKAGDPTLPRCERRDIEDHRIISPFGKVPGAKDLINLTWDNKLTYLRTDVPIERGDTELTYVTVKSDKDVYCNLGSIKYTPMTDCSLNLEDEQVVFSGDTFINRFHHTRTLITDIDTNKSKAIWGVLAIIAAAVIAVVSYGVATPVAAIIAAAGVAALSIASIVEELKDGRYNDCLQAQFSPGDGFLFGDGYVLFEGDHIYNLWTENEVNYDLVHSGESEYAKRINDFDLTDRDKALEAYLKHKIVTQDVEEDKELVRDIIIPETYLYNYDYSITDSVESLPPLGPNYDYCNNCEELYPNTVIWSERGFDTDLSDSNRVFLPLNSTTVGSHSGPITDMKFDRNRLTMTTMTSVFGLAPNPRILQTDQEQVFTGVGDFLSIPEQEMVKTDWGYAGNQSMYSAINSPYGWTYPDAKAGEVFNYTDRLERISDRGMKHWFKENLPFKLTCEVPEYTCTDSLYGVGTRAVFDPRYKRYILTKRDYLPLNYLGLVRERMIRDKMYFDPTTQEFMVNGEVVGFDNEEYFCNCSWTISYSYLHQAWDSFHSYLPTYMYNDHETFYTSEGDAIWSHDSKFKYCTFYGTKYDFDVEYIINSPSTYDLHALHWYSRSKIYDEETKRWITVPETFDRLMVYTDCQSTGLVNLVLLDKCENPYGNLAWSNAVKEVILTEKDYKVDELRDISIGQPVVRFECGNIDCQPNYINLDYDTTEYQLNDLKNKYHHVKMYFKPERDVKIILDLVNSRTFQSVH